MHAITASGNTVPLPAASGIDHANALPSTADGSSVRAMAGSPRAGLLLQRPVPFAFEDFQELVQTRARLDIKDWSRKPESRATLEAYGHRLTTCEARKLLSPGVRLANGNIKALTKNMTSAQIKDLLDDLGQSKWSIQRLLTNLTARQIKEVTPMLTGRTRQLVGAPLPHLPEPSMTHFISNLPTTLSDEERKQKVVEEFWKQCAQWAQ